MQIGSGDLEIRIAEIDEQLQTLEPDLAEAVVELSHAIATMNPVLYRVILRYCRWLESRCQRQLGNDIWDCFEGYVLPGRLDIHGIQIDHSTRMASLHRQAFLRQKEPDFLEALVSETSWLAFLAASRIMVSQSDLRLKLQIEEQIRGDWGLKRMTEKVFALRMRANKLELDVAHLHANKQKFLIELEVARDTERRVSEEANRSLVMYLDSLITETNLPVTVGELLVEFKLCEEVQGYGTFGHIFLQDPWSLPTFCQVLTIHNSIRTGLCTDCAKFGQDSNRARRHLAVDHLGLNWNATKKLIEYHWLAISKACGVPPFVSIDALGSFPLPLGKVLSLALIEEMESERKRRNMASKGHF